MPVGTRGLCTRSCCLQHERRLANARGHAWAVHLCCTSMELWLLHGGLGSQQPSRCLGCCTAALAVSMLVHKRRLANDHGLCSHALAAARWPCLAACSCCLQHQRRLANAHRGLSPCQPPKSPDKPPPNLNLTPRTHILRFYEARGKFWTRFEKLEFFTILPFSLSISTKRLFSDQRHEKYPSFTC